MAIKPITPEEALLKQETSIPGFVIEAANELIVENFRNGRSAFKLSELRARILAKVNNDVEIEDRWLDIEPMYRKNGWNVVYDSPGYCESYPATFSFVRKKND